jgi:hypothetical protein
MSARWSSCIAPQLRQTGIIEGSKCPSKETDPAKAKSCRLAFCALLNPALSNPPKPDSVKPPRLANSHGKPPKKLPIRAFLLRQHRVSRAPVALLVRVRSPANAGPKNAAFEPCPNHGVVPPETLAGSLTIASRPAAAASGNGACPGPARGRRCGCRQPRDRGTDSPGYPEPFGRPGH